MEEFNQIHDIEREIVVVEAKITNLEQEIKALDEGSVALENQARMLDREAERNRGLLGLFRRFLTGGASPVAAPGIGGINERINFQSASECRSSAKEMRRKASDKRAERIELVTRKDELENQIKRLKRKRDASGVSLAFVTKEEELIDITILNKLCWWNGRKSQEVTDWCTRNINGLKKMSSEFKRVWAAFKPENENQIIFVVECTDRESAARVMLHKPLSTLDIEFIDINAHSKEDNDVMFSEEKNNKKLTDDELNKVNSNFFDISENLLDQHSNLSIIQACSVKSKNYGKQSHTIIKETCIVLYVHAKGLIPIAEDQFPKEINGLPTDVREGTFHLYGKRSQEYYQHLRMGCQITGEFPKSGTLGAVVELSNDRVGLIVPAHVVLPDTWQDHLQNNNTIVNCKVYQPQQDNSHSHFGQIVKAVYRLGKYGEAGYELALIDITDPTRRPNTGLFPEGDFTHAGFTSTDPMEYTSGIICGDPNHVSWMKIIKYGSETEITVGNIEQVGSNVCRDMLFDSTAQIRLYNQIVISGLAHRPFAQQGDSGALVFSVYQGDKNDLRPVGILAGGNSDGSYCYVTPIQDALNAFGYNLWLAKFTPHQANKNADTEPMEQ